MARGRIGRGWQLAKESWAVLRADRSLLMFPVVSGIAIVLAAIVLAGPGTALYASDTSKPGGIVLWAIAAYALTFIAIYCNVALAAAASQSLDGRDSTLASGFAVARQRTGIIAAWSLVALVVGALLQALEALLSETPAGRIVGAIVTSLLSAAWSVVTFFVVPVLALEGLGPKAALTRSAGVIRERWGEGFVGSASITGLVFLVAVLPAIVVGAIGVGIAGSSPAGGGVLIAIAVVIVVAALLVGSTLSAIFRVVLFRYATDGTTAPGFSAAQLERAFVPKRGRRGRQI
ncbi:MAG: hypothetical protein JWQ48_2917 [Conexibacter sp.]|jgi:hypothetical protein|nr:hypothetical protein [Conexibacter sp.]